MRIGGSVFFLSDRDASGEEELFVAPQDGKGEPVKVAAATNTWHFPPVWSGDSKKLAYVKSVENDFRVVFLHSLATKKTVAVTSTSSNSTEPFFDPEGKYLYLLSEKAVVWIRGRGGGMVDGGYTFVPEFGSYDLKSQWVMENEGVTPDIEVDNLPADELAGKDAQLERGIAEVPKRLDASPSKWAPLPCLTDPRESDRYSGKSRPDPTLR